ncbi:hypothetical protein AB0F15_23360 [Amycolatopsis sp. NPDC026612]|uniref:hypothetical protein n=1 Tax=Amycolatopsis sp. NPDC026612 TaxID=3155466 RepID=UPI0033E08B83
MKPEKAPGGNADLQVARAELVLARPVHLPPASLRSGARASGAAVDNLYETISSLRQSDSPDVVEVAVAGTNTSKDVGIAEGVDVRKSAGILIGDNGQINVLNTCNVVKPLIQFADLSCADACPSAQTNRWAERVAACRIPISRPSAGGRISADCGCCARRRRHPS